LEAIGVSKPIMGLTMVLILFCGLTFFAFLPIAFGQNSTSVGGIVSTDTAWTAANSPYMLTQNVTVSSDATLTIEPGTTIFSLMDTSDWVPYSIIVQGTIVATGTPANPTNITLTSGQIIFENTSQSYNPQTKAGSTLDGVILQKTALSISSSPRIHNVTMSGAGKENVITIYAGAPEISNSSITAGVDNINLINVKAGSPQILNNNLTAFVDNGLLDLFGVASSNLNRYGTVDAVFVGGGNPYIYGNVMSRCKDAAIYVRAGNPTIEANLITNNAVTITANFFATPLIKENQYIDNGSPSGPEETPNSTPLPAALSIDVSPSTVQFGSTVTVSGDVMVNGTRVDVVAVDQFGNRFVGAVAVQTGGNFRFTWVPSVAGPYNVMATLRAIDYKGDYYRVEPTALTTLTVSSPPPPVSPSPATTPTVTMQPTIYPTASPTASSTQNPTNNNGIPAWVQGMLIVTVAVLIAVASIVAFRVVLRRKSKS
jgi:hypothetical protein